MRPAWRRIDLKTYLPVSQGALTVIAIHVHGVGNVLPQTLIVITSATSSRQALVMAMRLLLEVFATGVPFFTFWSQVYVGATVASFGTLFGYHIQRNLDSTSTTTDVPSSRNRVRTHRSNSTTLIAAAGLGRSTTRIWRGRFSTCSDLISAATDPRPHLASGFLGGLRRGEQQLHEDYPSSRSWCWRRGRSIVREPEATGEPQACFVSLYDSHAHGGMFLGSQIRRYCP